MLTSRRSNSTSIFAVPQKYHLSPLKVKLFSTVVNTHTYIHKTKPVSETLNKDTGNAYTALYFPISCQCLTGTLQGRSHPFQLPSYIPFWLPMRLDRVNYPSWTANMSVTFRPYCFRIIFFHSTINSPGYCFYSIFFPNPFLIHCDLTFHSLVNLTCRSQLTWSSNSTNKEIISLSNQST